MNDYVVVEVMPLYLRESVKASGNYGRWPHNGANRYIVKASVADDLVKSGDGWVFIVSSLPTTTGDYDIDERGDRVRVDCTGAV
jgi:hypothetical protein